MKPQIQEFLSRRLPVPGVAAWGIRFADRELANHCYNDWFNARQIEQLMPRLTLFIENLAQHRIEPARLSWVFERARILLALRKDSTCLALFVENRPGSTTAALDELLEEFRNLPAE